MGPETKLLFQLTTSEESSGWRALGEASIHPHLQRSCWRPGTPSCHRKSKSPVPDTPGLVALPFKNSLPPGSLSVHLWPEGQVLWRGHEDTLSDQSERKRNYYMP